MSGFSESAFQKKLSDLNNSAQSIQQLSLWLIHHRKHYKTSVKVWFHALGKTSAHRKLTFLYLANDVVQNTKKKSPEIAKEFGTVMKKVLEHLSVLVLDEKTVKSIDRLLSIWTERDIFEKSLQDDLNRIWATKKLELEAAASDDKEPGTPPPQKKPKKADSPPKKKIRVAVAPSEEKKVRKDSTSSNKASSQQPLVDDDDDLLNSILSSDSPNSDEVDDDGDDGGRPHGDPPDPEELMKALTELENSPSSDAVVREKIAKLPASVSEVGLLDNLKSPEDAQKLLKKVDEAVNLLADYNDRLQNELKDRRKVNKMIEDFLAAQKFLEAQAEERLEHYRDVLEKYNGVGEELKSHVQSLPDLTKLPDVTTGGLAPLPSAGDLFTANKS